jgi:diaminopimelate decarboxylase
MQEGTKKMFVSENLSVNEKGHLAVSGVDTTELAKEYGTPLYVMDEELIRSTCRRFKSSIEKYYGGAGLVCYASKAFCCKEMCRIMKSEGIGLDVVSGGELYTAASVDFPMENVCFHGNNKTDEELSLALEKKVGRIIVDNIFELERLNSLAEKAGVTANIMYRIKPGIDAHTHNFIRTGQIDSKFGFALETGEAFDAVKKAIELKNINLAGLHCHIGSQIFDIDPFVHAAEVMLGFIAKIKNELGFEVKQLNLGGGFGIKYTENDNPVPFENYMEKVSVKVKEICEKENIALPFILIEPGRSIAAPAGLTLYTVGGIKHIPNIRTYVSIDGGMTDNPRYALYKSEYDIEVANRAGEPKTETITLAGKCCESGDLIGENMPVQHIEEGDIVAVLATGAYNYSMSSNYNRIPKPAVVMVNEGKSRVVVKRETMEDVVRNDV